MNIKCLILSNGSIMLVPHLYILFLNLRLLLLKWGYACLFHNGGMKIKLLQKVPGTVFNKYSLSSPYVFPVS